jgi:two-component system invasion response regulator UvrY
MFVSHNQGVLKMINVMLVDDHDLVRSGIKSMLTDVGDIEVVAEADSGEQAVRQAREIKPDVILMDLSMPGIGGMEATRKITRSMPGAKIIAVTVHEDEPFPARLLEAGAVGYLTKGCDVREIIVAIKSVYLGEQYLTPEVAQKLALSFVNHRDKAPLEELTLRETQVMLMIVKGAPNKQISEKLCLSPKTTSTYRYRLFEKLGVINDVELTRFAIRHGLIKENLIH